MPGYWTFMINALPAIAGAMHWPSEAAAARRFDGFEQVVEAAVIQPLQVGFSAANGSEGT